MGRRWAPASARARGREEGGRFANQSYQRGGGKDARPRREPHWVVAFAGTRGGGSLRVGKFGGRKKPVLVAPRGGLLPSQEQEGMGFCIRDDRWGRSYGGTRAGGSRTAPTRGEDAACRQVWGRAWGRWVSASLLMGRRARGRGSSGGGGWGKGWGGWGWGLRGEQEGEGAPVLAAPRTGFLPSQEQGRGTLGVGKFVDGEEGKTGGAGERDGGSPSSPRPAVGPCLRRGDEEGEGWGCCLRGTLATGEEDGRFAEPVSETG